MNFATSRPKFKIQLNFTIDISRAKHLDHLTMKFVMGLESRCWRPKCHPIQLLTYLSCVV